MAAQQLTQSAKNLNPSLVVQELQKEAKTNQVFNSVCYVWAHRERARSQVTLASLRLQMQRAGYNYTREEYVNVLKLLASLDLGKLAYSEDSHKQVVALIDIKMTLQSIGKAAINQADRLDSFQPANVYHNLPIESSDASPKREPKFRVKLMTEMNGTPMTFETPLELTANELAALLGEMFAKGAKNVKSN